MAGKPTAKGVERRSLKKINDIDKLKQVDEFGKPLFLRCKSCNKIKPVKEFYQTASPNNAIGLSYLCKDCCKMMSLDDEGMFNRYKVYELCRILDQPFVNEYFNEVDDMVSTIAAPKDERTKIGIYIKLVNSRNTRPKYAKAGFEMSDEPMDTPIGEDKTENNAQSKDDNTDLWGVGWRAEEYRQLNELYKKYLNNYPLRTEMHRMALVKICKLQVRYDAAIAQNNTADAKYWGDLLSKAQNEAKFNPSQLSAADLSDGMSTFSQIAQAVEREMDIIPLLPQYIARPNDRVDYTIYMIFDYLRDLEGKPHITYQDVWKFMQSNYGRNKKEFGEDIVPDESKMASDAILVDGED